MVAQRTVTIKNKLGLHARPAALLVRTASKFKSDIKLIKDGQEVNGKSIMGVMMLAAEMGSKITIYAEGKDAQLAVDKLAELFENKFEED
ncbi:phosphocarrier protein HPr [candidate division KSB1 bacterium]|nr:HPr family phosphocarrier protein [bacterium]RKY73905.1 MAG: phosphocarrier protein HPr [candidate division KSB1 bacterium]HDI52350.1 HPr family phosphocarrier protein [Bacteroidota bacterium]RKY80016.1 MAG: phosphocarrier protein HPr [candidate division KSB1 bacterium]RKY85352.1 MAG: phosphocarrier protein HPr [candidate division KSB1 bacterium]